MKLVVEEAESSALIAEIEGRGPYLTNVVGEIETLRVCRRAGIPPAQVEELRRGLTLIALNDDVRRLAGAVGPPTLRTLDAIHLATAVSLRDELDAMAIYDLQLAKPAEDAGLLVISPS